MKLLDLVTAREALQRLVSLELPAATSFQIARTMRPINAELQTYEQARVALVQRFGQDNGKGQTIVPPDKFVEFNIEHQTLLDVELKLDITPLSPDVLGEVAMTPGDLMALYFLFDDE